MPINEVNPRGLSWLKYYRIIPSRMPVINFLEKYVDADKLHAAFEVECMTNDRLRQEVGNLNLVKPADCVTGPNATVVMAAFTHIGRPSRFSDGSFGVFYAASSIKAAIKETIFHRERFLRFTNSPARVLEMRCYTGTVKKPLLDIRSINDFHNPDIRYYPATQQFGMKQRKTGANGLLYQSVRHPESECIAIYKPKAVSLPVQKNHYQYHWNGEKIEYVLKMEQVKIA